MKLLNFVIIKLTFFLVIGILFGLYMPISWESILISFIFSLVLLAILFIYADKKLKQGYLFGIIAFLTTFQVGVLTITFHQQKNHQNHYTKKLNTNNPYYAQLSIKKVLKDNDFYERYEAYIQKIDKQNASGTLLVNIKKDSVSLPLTVGDVITSWVLFREIKPPLNPSLFNYKEYLRRNHIYHQLYLDKDAIVLAKKSNSSIHRMAANWRKNINTALILNEFKSNELSIINALLLGQRTTIDEDIYTNYINAGAVHILAVSGLHVGIVLLVLNFLFNPLARFKYGKTVKLVLVISLLWLFALVAGLSPSVVRSVTMFSFVSLGMHHRKPTNIYNTLFVSMFILLLIKPEFLFDVGFQLSYAAVLSIVWIQPQLYRLWLPKYMIPNYFWKLLTVTLAAQIGVLPISLFYFHQFPGLFFISNLVIIPFIGLILSIGVIVVLLALMNLLPSFLVTFYSFLLNAMNSFVKWVALQETFLFKNIFFDKSLFIVSYIMIISLVLLLKKQRPRQIVFFLTTFLLFQSVLIYHKYLTETTNAFIVFNNSKNTLLGQKISDELIVYTNDCITNVFNDYKVLNGIKNIRKDKNKNIYPIGNDILLQVDSFGVYKIPHLRPKYVLLTQSPKINLERLIHTIQPKVIIADASNYKNLKAQWKTTCLKEKLPFHDTSEKGVFIINF
ncbi:ComEC/Rec2 family competence protein [Leptobacterium sp. I13]|uniref:ComEC/Rec2 family competence protein n=1 Tax=Leptobacterium meishanense TaxID=3128904 RepID=UPI0030EC32CC